MALRYPPIAKDRGAGFWLRPSNLWASRRIFRSDHSVEWRKRYRNPNGPLNRSEPFSKLVKPGREDDFSFVILGDTGEGDKSQYALLPMIRELKPEFIIINGDVTYPAGNKDDYLYGLFEPYRNLGIPIWAVPGNHDYYSSNQGREFYHTFCTRSWASLWFDYGLKLVPQPGTYWELRDPRSNGNDLVVIGLDTGKKANLDGDGGKPADVEQMTWFNDRLKVAQSQGKKVMVLFHIPYLGDQEWKKKHSMFQMHHLLGKYDCVKMVVTAHQHNFQLYSPTVFRSFLNKVAPGTKASAARPHYIVSGAGGATLGSVLFKTNDYQADTTYPSEEQWDQYKGIGQNTVVKLNLGRSLLYQIVSKINEAAGLDTDFPGLVSFLHVRVGAGGIAVQPVFVDDVRSLYRDVDTRSIDITDPAVSLDQAAVQRTLLHPAIQL